MMTNPNCRNTPNPNYVNATYRTWWIALGESKDIKIGPPPKKVNMPQLKMFKNGKFIPYY